VGYRPHVWGQALAVSCPNACVRQISARHEQGEWIHLYLSWNCAAASREAINECPVMPNPSVNRTRYGRFGEMRLTAVSPLMTFAAGEAFGLLVAI
jgi:hypothetical protein